MIYLYIAMGSAMGGMARYWCANAAALMFGASFPYGILGINALGSFVIGAAARYAEALDNARQMPFRALVMVGLCGGYTTFSSFSLHTFEMLHKGAFAAAISNVVLSVLLCVGLAALGYASVGR